MTGSNTTLPCCQGSERKIEMCALFQTERISFKGIWKSERGKTARELIEIY